MKLKVRMESNGLAKQSFGIVEIHKDDILYELRLWKKKKKKKKDEQN